MIKRLNHPLTQSLNHRIIESPVTKSPLLDPSLITHYAFINPYSASPPRFR
jgi:hypothetical protein